MKPSIQKAINQINQRDLDIALRRIGRLTIAGAVEQHAGVLASIGVNLGAIDSKDLQVDALTQAIMQGALTLDQVQNAQPVPSRPAAGVNFEPIIGVRLDGLTAVANRADSLALSASTQSLDALKRIDELRGDIVGLESAIQRISKAPKAEVTDKSSINAAVAAAVADAVEPFKRAIESNPAVADRLAGASAAWVVESKPVLEVFGVDVFNVRGEPLMVDIWNHPDAPRVDPSFIWSEGILRHLLISQQTGENVWFGGEKGTGKSETARQFAARTGRAFVRINFEKYTSKEDYLGATGLVDGETVFQPQAFLTAFETPSTVILLDELTNADPANLAPLNGFLEPLSAVSYGGAVRTRAAGVLVFAADNTLSNGDDSGRYAGTRLMNSALADRFSRVISFQYLPIEKEAAALVNHTNCTDDLAMHVMQAITVARGKVQTADIIDAPSIRSAIAFIRALDVLPLEEAWQTAVVNRQPAESHAALQSIFASCINPTIINRNLGV